MLRSWAALLIVVSLLCVSRSAEADEISVWVDRSLSQLVELYKHFHANPELSHYEVQTAQRLAEELNAAGAEVTGGVGGTGVVGMLRNGAGKTLLLRTDLDALPVTEATGLPYASKVRVENPTGSGEVGVMHACGHDVHITNLIGVARYLSQHRDAWRGTVMFIGQPAEERVAGAKAMLDDGLYERFAKPDFAVALHVDSTLETGKVGYRAGYAMANVDSCDITVLGRGGHGAQPHTTIDPIVLAAQLVIALQTIVAREVSPIEPAVITVGSIHGGDKHNIISDRCHLQLTIRSYSSQVRAQLREAIERKARGIAATAGAPEPIVKFSEGTDAVYNDDALTARMAGVFRRVLGEENVILSEPTMGAEDFGLFNRGDVPVSMYRLGSITPQRMKQLGRPMSLHSPLYYPDIEPTLRTGLNSMIAVSLDLLKP